MSAMVVIVFGLASIMFLSAALIAFALMLRGQWDKMSDGHGPTRGARKR
jgi:hypothetical protein